MNNSIAPTRRSASKTIYRAFQILKENGGQMNRTQLLEEIEKSVEFEPWEYETYKNGQVKWITIFIFYSVDCTKAGWIVKSGGEWILTKEGEAALKMDPLTLLTEAGKLYRKWKNESILATEPADVEDDTQKHSVKNSIKNEELEIQALAGIGRYLEENINPYEFQDIVKTLLKAMGFHVDFIAGKGADGGIDIIAYKDPLGVEKPRIKVQVKNYNQSNKVTVNPVKELKGMLNANEHVGLFVTSGYFTNEAIKFARQSDVHIRLIDRNEFISLWIKHYPSMNEDEKRLLPLKAIYFLGVD